MKCKPWIRHFQPRNFQCFSSRFAFHGLRALDWRECQKLRLHSLSTKTRGSAPQTPDINENDQNGACSGTNMTGRPRDRTMEMTGGSAASYLVRTPCVPVFLLFFNKSGSKRGLLDFQGRRGITSVVRWHPHPVIFGVDVSLTHLHRLPMTPFSPPWVSRVNKVHLACDVSDHLRTNTKTNEWAQAAPRTRRRISMSDDACKFGLPQVSKNNHVQTSLESNWSKYRCRVVPATRSNILFREGFLGILAGIKIFHCRYKFSLEFNLPSTTDIDFGREANDFCNANVDKIITCRVSENSNWMHAPIIAALPPWPNW